MKDYSHQTRVVEESWDKVGWNLYCDTGTGKSRMAVQTAERLYAAGKISGVLVIAPGGMYRNWEEQWKIHASAYTGAMKIWRAALTPAARRSLLESIAMPNGSLEILLMNVEAFSSAVPTKNVTPRQIAEAFLRVHKTLLVIDESTSIRKPGSSRTQTLLQLGPLAAHRRNLSGLPNPEAPTDLYTQCLMLQVPFALFPFKSYYAFRNTFCTVEDEFIRVKGGGFQKIQKVTGAQRQSELRELLLNFSSLVSKKECLDLPPKVYQRRYVDMTDDQSRLYTTAQKKALYTVAGTAGTGSATSADASATSEVSVANRMGQLEKLHQISCGLIKDDAGKWHHVKTRLYDELLEQLAEISGKVVIYSVYTAQIDEIVRRLNEHYGPGTASAFYGSTSQDDRVRLVREYQDPASRLRYLVANTATGKFGWTLTAGSVAIYLSSNHEAEPRHQSEDRLHRIGQQGTSVTYIDFLTRNTLGEKILDSVMGKRNVAAEIMGPAWTQELYGTQLQ